MMASPFRSDHMKSGKVNLFQLFVWMQKPKQEQISNLQELDLLAKMYACPVCGLNMVLSASSRSTDGYEWRCQKGNHSIKRSIRKGSWFHNSKMTICSILTLTYMWCSKYPPHFIRKELGIEMSPALTDWLFLCRDVCIDFVMHRSERIGGVGKVVEIDESKIGERMCTRGRHLEGKWAFSGVEKGSNKGFMVPVEEKSKESLLLVITKWVVTGSLIYCNKWNPYDYLGDEGCKLLSENHSIQFMDSTKRFECFWRTAKKNVMEKSKQTDIFDGYLAETFYRRLVGENEDLFFEFIKNIAVVYVPNTSD